MDRHGQGATQTPKKRMSGAKIGPRGEMQA